MGPKKTITTNTRNLPELNTGESQEKYIQEKKRKIFFGDQRSRDIQSKLNSKRELSPKEKGEGA